VLPSCPLSRAFPYPQPGDAGGRCSAPAVCQSLTSADPPTSQFNLLDILKIKITLYCAHVCRISSAIPWQLQTRWIQEWRHWL